METGDEAGRRHLTWGGVNKRRKVGDMQEPCWPVWLHTVTGPGQLRGLRRAQGSQNQDRGLIGEEEGVPAGFESRGEVTKPTVVCRRG